MTSKHTEPDLQSTKQKTIKLAYVTIFYQHEIAAYFKQMVLRSLYFKYIKSNTTNRKMQKPNVVVHLQNNHKPYKFVIHPISYPNTSKVIVKWWWRVVMVDLTDSILNLINAIACHFMTSFSVYTILTKLLN